MFVLINYRNREVSFHRRHANSCGSVRAGIRSHVLIDWRGRISLIYEQIISQAYGWSEKCIYVVLTLDIEVVTQSSCCRR